MKLICKKNYWTTMTRIVGLILCALSIVYFFKGGNIVLYILLFTVFILFLLVKKTIKTILIVSDQIIIEYYRFMKLQKQAYTLSEIKLELKEKVTNRFGSTVKGIDIFFLDKVLFSITSNDGFETTDLESFYFAYCNKI